MEFTMRNWFVSYVISIFSCAIDQILITSILMTLNGLVWTVKLYN